MPNANDALKQASVRGATGTTLDYNGDWSALFTADGIAAGDWNGRLLSWINLKLTASHTNVNEAMHAYAVSKGANNWSSLGTFTP